MNDANENPGFNRWSIRLHWLMLALFVAVYAFIELRVLFEKGSDARETMKSLHFMFGLLVFALVWLRLFLRLRYAAPPIVPTPPAWQRLVSRAVHVVLYAFMIGMPLAGWVVLSAAGKPIPFFGLHLPALTGQDKALAGSIVEIHEAVGTAGYWIIGLHALAAIIHHYVWKDNTLLRMLPTRR
ncbi:cytochrome b [Luteimonas marina]|uniref:Cytochrome b n=1 Tax=Luteimonas marina TaxID=488485 RepID=A0A5C5U6J1_9GAMM|nr:cytochrome b [Luteimonas marina]TWT21447.1 cytochrome b [Luteimonas marina]